MRSERKKGRREKEARGGRRRRVQEGGESIRICFIKLTKEARKSTKTHKYIDKSFNRKEAEKAARGREVVFIDRRSRRIFSEKEKSLRV